MTFVVSGVWCLVPGVWCLVPGVWCLVHARLAGSQADSVAGVAFVAHIIVAYSAPERR